MLLYLWTDGVPASPVGVLVALVFVDVVPDLCVSNPCNNVSTGSTHTFIKYEKVRGAKQVHCQRIQHITDQHSIPLLWPPCMKTIKVSFPYPGIFCVGTTLYRKSSYIPTNTLNLHLFSYFHWEECFLVHKQNGTSVKLKGNLVGRFWNGDLHWT